MKRYILFWLVIFIFGCTSEDFQDYYQQQNLTTEELQKLLEDAYHSSKNKKSDLFFREWNNTIEPNEAEMVILDDTVKAIYEVFNTFYYPLELSRIFGQEWDGALSRSSRYVAIQNTISYSIVNSDNIEDYNWETATLYTLEDFRASVNIDEPKRLYLSEKYENAIQNFLTLNSLKFKGDMDSSELEEELKRRRDYVHKYIPVIRGHWVYSFYITTHPEVPKIVLNKDLTKAEVYFWLGVQGGKSILIKDNDVWKIESAKILWTQ